MDLLGLGERLAVVAKFDLVGVGEALGAVQLSRLQHAQADVDHNVGDALDRDGDERKAVLRGDSRGGLIRPARVVRTVVAHQECGDAQATGFDLGRELQLDYRGLAPAAGGDGRCRLVDALANGAAELPG